MSLGSRTSVAAALLAAATLAFSACGSSSPHGTGAADVVEEQLTPLSALTVPAAPRDLAGPATAVLADRSIEPVTDDPEQHLPVTVTSHDKDGDREVTVTDTSRIVAMDIAGSVAATVWALGLGDSVVGRDVAADFPGADELPVVTKDGHSVNAEAILDLEPTVLVTDGSIGPVDVVAQLRDAGVEVVFVENESSFAGAGELARQVAAVLGVPEAGEALAQRIDSEVAGVRAEIARFVPADPDQRIRMMFLYMRGSAGVYYIFGKDSGAEDLIAGLGGVDVPAELGWDELTPLTDEAMVAADPDLILVMTGGLESVGGVDELLASRPAIALTSAGQKRRIVDMADGDILSFGPRSAEVLDALARVVYAPGEVR